jgi:hypothetical protein
MRLANQAAGVWKRHAQDLVDRATTMANERMLDRQVLLIDCTPTLYSYCTNERMLDRQRLLREMAELERQLEEVKQ